MSGDNPDLDAIAGEETTTVRTAALRTLFDLAVNSMDFGSGFWETADTLVAREIAASLGLCPMVATPTEHRASFPVCEGLREGMAERREWRPRYWERNVENMKKLFGERWQLYVEPYREEDDAACLRQARHEDHPTTKES